MYYARMTNTDVMVRFACYMATSMTLKLGDGGLCS